jgi:hypothetical protein
MLFSWKSSFGTICSLRKVTAYLTYCSHGTRDFAAATTPEIVPHVTYDTLCPLRVHRIVLCHAEKKKASIEFHVSRFNWLIDQAQHVGWCESNEHKVSFGVPLHVSAAIAVND